MLHRVRGGSVWRAEWQVGDRTLTDGDVGTDFLEALSYGRYEVCPEGRSAREDHTY